MSQCSKIIITEKLEINRKNINGSVSKKKNPTKALKDIIKPFIESQNLSNANYNFRVRKTKIIKDNQDNDINSENIS